MGVSSTTAGLEVTVPVADRARDLLPVHATTGLPVRVRARHADRRGLSRQGK